MSKSSRTIPIKKLVNRKGKSFVTTVYISPKEEKRLKKRTNKTSADIHKKNGKYTAERTKVHREIMNKMVNSCPKPEKGKQPEVTLLLGGAASGKSTVVNTFLKDDAKNKGVINVDDVKEALPEYRKYVRQDVMTAANRVHQESSEIGKAVLNSVVSEKRNFIYDATLSKVGKAEDLIKKLKAAGYKINLVGVNVDAEDALGRAKVRALGDHEEGGKKLGSGRYVPDKILLNAHKGATEVFEKIKGLVDTHSLYDNNQEYGKPPTEVLKNGVVKNKSMYDAFKQKANLDISAILKKNLKKAIDFVFKAIGFMKAKSPEEIVLSEIKRLG